MKGLLSVGIACVWVTLAASAQTNTFPPSGNVGIGTTAPQAKLDIQGGGLRVGSSPVPQPISLGGEELIYFNNDGPIVSSGQIVGGLGFVGMGVRPCMA
jgi:hypothetical protein